MTKVQQKQAQIDLVTMQTTRETMRIEVPSLANEQSVDLDWTNELGTMVDRGLIETETFVRLMHVAMHLHLVTHRDGHPSRRCPAPRSPQDHMPSRILKTVCAYSARIACGREAEWGMGGPGEDSME